MPLTIASLEGLRGWCLRALETAFAGSSAGNTGWTDALVEVGRAAEPLVAEAAFRGKAVPYHHDLASLERKLDRICPKRRVLTHMREARRHAARCRRVALRDGA